MSTPSSSWASRVKNWADDAPSAERTLVVRWLEKQEPDMQEFYLKEIERTQGGWPAVLNCALSRSGKSTSGI
jgi:hypothetical protein